MHESITSELLEDFKPGDLLFGLEKEAREPVYHMLKERLHSLGAKYDLVTVDDINAILYEPLFVSNECRESPLQKLITPAKEFGLQLLEDPNFRPKLEELNNTPFTEERRRFLCACLAAIDNCKHTIRFCLDHLELNKVRDLKYPKEYHSYTSHELRHIAHNFEKVGAKVVFYFRSQRVAAPWRDEGKTPAEWLLDIPQDEPAQVEVAPARTQRSATIRALRFLGEPTDNTQDTFLAMHGSEEEIQQKRAKTEPSANMN